MTVNEIIRSLKENPEEWIDTPGAAILSNARLKIGVEYYHWMFLSGEFLNFDKTIKLIERLRLRWAIWRWRKFPKIWICRIKHAWIYAPGSDGEQRQCDRCKRCEFLDLFLEWRIF